MCADRFASSQCSAQSSTSSIINIMGWHGITSFLLHSLVVVNAYRGRNSIFSWELQKAASFRSGTCRLIKTSPPVDSSVGFEEGMSTTALPMAVDVPVKAIVRRGGSSMITSGRLYIWLYSLIKLNT